MTLSCPASPAAGPAGSDVIYDLRGISHRFRVSGGWRTAGHTVQALADIDLTIRRGEVVGIVGESGSGKTTLLRVLLNLLRPESGSALFRGRPLASWSRKAFGRQVQMVFQDPYGSLNPRRTIGAIIRQPLDVHRIGTRAERDTRVQELLAQVGLPDRVLTAQPRQLSGGQRQRVAIARALALSPQILILDEPTSALDVSVQAQILNLLDDLRDALGLTYVFVSHNLAVVDHMASRIHVLRSGRIIENGTPDEILSRPQQDYTRTLVRSILTLAPGAGLPGRLPQEVTP